MTKLPTRKTVEPHAPTTVGGVQGGSGSTPLPDDLVAAQCARMGLLYAVGDIHGCFDELRELLTRLGYEITEDWQKAYSVRAPEDRKVVFLGDLVDRAAVGIGRRRIEARCQGATDSLDVTRAGCREHRTVRGQWRQWS